MPTSWFWFPLRCLCYEFAVDSGNVFINIIQGYFIGTGTVTRNIDGLVKDCGIAIANALEILQSCTKPLIYWCKGPIPNHKTKWRRYFLGCTTIGTYKQQLGINLFCRRWNLIHMFAVCIDLSYTWWSSFGTEAGRATYSLPAWPLMGCALVSEAIRSHAINNGR